MLLEVDGPKNIQLKPFITSSRVNLTRRALSDRSSILNIPSADLSEDIEGLCQLGPSIALSWR